MTYLVTGCAGFIGAKVTEFLLQDDYTVVGVDNLNNAYDVCLKHWRLDQIKDHPNFNFYNLDICDRPALSQLFNSRFDAVVNLAARVGVRQSVADPEVYIQTNVTGVLNLLECCRQHGVSKFVLASSSSLYGTGNSRPFREDADTDGPLSPYAASKKAAEVLAYPYHCLHGLDVTVLRYFTVYGPAGRPDMSPFRFIQWIAEGEVVVVYGDGRQSRDFTFVDDIVRGTLAALKPMGYEIINLGSDRPMILMEVIRLIEALLDKKADIDVRARHPADVLATWADISKAERLLGWRPRVSFEEGLTRAVAWYLDNREWAREVLTPHYDQGPRAGDRR